MEPAYWLVVEMLTWCLPSVAVHQQARSLAGCCVGLVAAVAYFVLDPRMKGGPPDIRRQNHRRLQTSPRHINHDYVGLQ